MSKSFIDIYKLYVCKIKQLIYKFNGENLIDIGSIIQRNFKHSSDKSDLDFHTENNMSNLFFKILW
ncbi:MAG TPA: hypothetical protein DCY06_04165 [Bacteroidetes bacterium]|nr:hypothetical protein [Bacteroidota bacterium]